MAEDKSFDALSSVSIFSNKFFKVRTEFFSVRSFILLHQTFKDFFKFQAIYC